MFLISAFFLKNILEKKDWISILFFGESKLLKVPWNMFLKKNKNKNNNFRNNNNHQKLKRISENEII